MRGRYKHVVKAQGADREDPDEYLTPAALRDTLLPKLISGEPRVQDAQRFVGGVDRVDEVDSGGA